MRSNVVEFQYDLFETPQERLIRLRLEETEQKLARAVKTLDKVRKGTYAQLNELCSKLEDQSSRLEIIERNICR